MNVETTREGKIEVSRCETATDFLAYLQLRDDRWSDVTHLTGCPWIFRGHRKAMWSLLPMAMRTDKFKAYKTKYRDVIRRELGKSGMFTLPGEISILEQVDGSDELTLQVLAEWHYVAEFVRLADQVGYAIPEDKNIGDISRSPEDVIRSLMHSDKVHSRQYRFDPIQIEYCLAQHHGIPTRLLDFTDMSFAAAFFAAEDAVNHPDPLDDIAVWAVNQNALKHSALKEVRPRRGKIAYLHAQSGLFVYDTKANQHFLKSGTWRPFEDVLAEGPSGIELDIRKITLNSVHAAEVIWLLAKENFTRAHLMPTYDNITKTIEMSDMIQP